MIISHILHHISKFPPIRSILFFFYGKAALTMSKELAHYIMQENRVLDLGCGTGIIGSTLARTLKTSIVGVDVRDAREVDIPFALCDGKHLPFPNRMFDIVLISYVLHHVDEVEILLKEAYRVCRGKVIIYEDTPQNLFHHISCFLHGFSYGSLFNIRKRCKFRARQEWVSLFQKLHLSILRTGDINFFNPIHVTARSLFILSPPQNKTL